MEKGMRKNGKKWNREGEENEKCKGGKGMKKLRTFFFFFFFFFFFGFSLSGSHWNFFVVYQNGNFYRENTKIGPGKNREKWLCHPPLKNFPVTPLNPSHQNSACRLQKKYDISFIWKNFLLAQKWKCSHVN